MEGVVPRPDVAPFLQQHFVALAADCDDPEGEVIDLAQNLEDAMMLPFVMLVDANGEFLAGSSGAQTPADLAALLRHAVDRA